MSPRLLVVDDSPEVATLVRWIGRRSGREITIAPSAEVALGLLGQAPEHDLILVDINLPGMDGIEFSRLLIRRGGVWPLVVFIQSGLVEDLQRAVLAGIEYALYKDHLAHPDRWNARCNEILADLSERSSAMPSAARSGLLDIAPLSLTAVQSALESALGSHRASLVSALVERAWLRLPLALGVVPSGLPAAQVATLVENLDGLLWRLLGREESRAAREALQPFTLLASGGEPIQ